MPGSEQVRMPFWTVDADVYRLVVGSRALRGSHDQTEAQPIDASISRSPEESCGAYRMVTGHRFAITSPGRRLTSGWILDGSLLPVKKRRGGSRQALRTLHEFVNKKMPDTRPAQSPGGRWHQPAFSLCILAIWTADRSTCGAECTAPCKPGRLFWNKSSSGGNWR